MQFDTKQRQDALRAFMDRSGLKKSPWEKEAGLGGGTVRKFLIRERGTMTDKTYEALAGAASRLLNREVHADELKGTQEPGDISPSGNVHLMQPDTNTVVVTPLPPLVLYRSSPGRESRGRTLIFRQKIGEVERLRKYEFAQKAFCTEATDDLMAPFARARDVIIVDPDKIPRKGDECLFVRDAEADPMDTVLRHLLEIKADCWHVCEHNGRKTPYDLSFADYPHAWPAVGVIKP